MARSGANECFHAHFVFVARCPQARKGCNNMQIHANTSFQLGSIQQLEDTCETLEFVVFPSVGAFSNIFKP